MRGIAGYGRYDDDPEHVACPRARSSMTPCIARDGHLALAGEPFSGRRDCVGCAITPHRAITELWEARFAPAAAAQMAPPAGPGGRPLDAADRWADTLTGLVHDATGPLADKIRARHG